MRMNGEEQGDGNESLRLGDIIYSNCFPVHARLIDRPRPDDPRLFPGIPSLLNRLLREARAAERMPWSPPDTQQWRTLFPQLAQALPAEEARELCAAFEAELARLEPSRAA